MLMTQRLGELEILTAGSGGEKHRSTPLLFIHGAFAGAWMWADTFLPWFAGQGYCCHALSLRGHGGSGGRSRLDEHAIDDYVADVLAVIEAMGEAPVLIGHSMGGFVAQKVLEKCRLPAVVLLCSVPPQGLLAAQFSLLLHNPGLFVDINRVLDGSNTDTSVVRQALFAQPVQDAVLESFLDRMQSESKRALWDMSLFNLPCLLGCERPPLLVLGAEKDVLIPPFLVQATGLTYRQPVHIFPGMGHMLTHEQDWPQVASRIAGWLEETLP